jgi:hypothetical protein
MTDSRRQEIENLVNEYGLNEFVEGVDSTRREQPNELMADIDALIKDAVPEGFVLVPREPTELMWICGSKAATYTDQDGVLMCISGRSAVACYRAMLAAIAQENP